MHTFFSKYFQQFEMQMRSVSEESAANKKLDKRWQLHVNLTWFMVGEYDVCGEQVESSSCTGAADAN